MMMRYPAILFVAAALVATTFVATTPVATTLGATSAAAQVISPIPPGSSQRPEQPLRITSTFRTTLTMAPTQIVPDAAAQEAGRRALYAMAADECAVLSETFKSDCRLTSVQIVAFPPLGSSAQPANILNATATYELRPLRQPQAR
jgi:hypothetical protein